MQLVAAARLEKRKKEAWSAQTLQPILIEETRRYQLNIAAIAVGVAVGVAAAAVAIVAIVVEAVVALAGELPVPVPVPMLLTV